MKALMLEGEKTLALREIPEPETRDNAQLVTIEAVSIGGSEYLGFNKPGIRPLPNVMGHGFSGMTPDGKRVAVYPLTGCGICHYCLSKQAQLCEKWSLIGVQTDGGFTQKASISNDQLFELPDDMSWEQSVFIEPFANSVNAWEISGATNNSSVAVIGAGSLGLGLVAQAVKSGCKSIHISDLSPTRREAAKSIGAIKTFAELNTTYDVVFDTVGSVKARNQAIQLSKKGGVCVFLGFETAELNINMSEIIRHQKNLKGSFVYSKNQFRKAIELAKMCSNDWVKSVTFNEVENILKGFLEGDFDPVKIALRPNNV